MNPRSHRPSKETTLVVMSSHPPLLDRRAVVLSHLAAILDSSAARSTSRSARICRELARRSDGELAAMLREREKLEKFAAAVEEEEQSTGPPPPPPQSSGTEQREHLGNLLFDKVAKIDTELSAQITGMLLELDPVLIQNLLSDLPALRSAVMKAKEEYLREKHPGWSAEWSVTASAAAAEGGGEDVGDAVYEEVHLLYPCNAPQITGMLLELPASCLHGLLHNRPELLRHIHDSKHALQRVNKWLLE